VKTPSSVAAVLVIVVAASGSFVSAQPSPAGADPPVPFGKVIYRATKAASFESLGVTVIMCRHFDPGPRRFAVDFHGPDGKKIGMFGPSVAYDVPPGKKVVFVGDGRYYRDRDVIDFRLGHFTGGPGRVISDAERVKCMGKIRMDAGMRAPSKFMGIGFHREGEPPPPEEEVWR
jgi:hypothetical protein